MKKVTSYTHQVATPSALTQHAENCGIFKFRSREIGGPYENLGEIVGADGQSFGFRAQMKRHPLDGAVLVIVDGYAHNVEEGDFGFGFTLLRFHTGSLDGPFTEHNVYTLGRETATIGWQWSADPNNSDEYRFDCRMADPRCMRDINPSLFNLIRQYLVINGIRSSSTACSFWRTAASW